MRNLYLIIILVTFISCKSQNEVWYSTEEVCDCYSKSKELNLDLKLNSCIDSTNQKLIKEDVDFGKKSQTQISNLIRNLINECPRYQNDFNENFFSKFTRKNYTLINQKDSITKLISNDIDKAKNLGKLAEINLQENQFDKSMDLINQSISLDPKIEYSYWIRAFLFQRQKNFLKAIEDFEKTKALKKESILKVFDELMIENLKMEMKKNK